MEDQWIEKSDGRTIDQPGSDLFPRAFIIALQAPSNYVGPDVVFGHDGDNSLGIPPQAPLPMHNPVEDADPWLPPRHKSSHVVTADLPSSLKEALQVFVLSIAARIALGQKASHGSMLIHVTRFTAVQTQVTAQVQTYLDALYANLESSPDREVRWQNLKRLWDTQFAQFFTQFKAHSSQQLDPPRLPAWTEVKREVTTAFRRLKCVMVNSETKESLDFAGNEANGLVVVAVGGDRLSRGLTLEGLTVSYFLRGARAYDTLMQMGRWFGFRPGYAHLCRVYAPSGIVKNFRTIALATEELRREFSRMCFLNKTPRDYGLRVREPRADLLVTALNKMRRGESVRVHFAESLISSLEIPESALGSNFEAFQKLTASIEEKEGKPNPFGSNHRWDGVAWEILEPFFSTYTATSHVCLTRDSSRSLLHSYINSVHQYGDLEEWTVVVIGSAKGKALKGTPFKTVSRKRLMKLEDPKQPENPGRVTFRGVALGSDESLDLTEDQQAHAKSVEDNFKSLAAAFRAERPSSRGLLLVYPIIPSTKDELDAQSSKAWEDANLPPLIGVAVSLPGSKHDKGCDYVFNPEAVRQMFGTLVEDAERDDEEDAALSV